MTPMRQFVFLLACLFWVASAGVAQGQIFEIMPPGIQNFPNMPGANSPFNFSYRIHKTSPNSTYSGTLRTAVRVNGITFYPGDSVLVNNVGQSGQIQMTAATFTVTSPPFQLNALNGVVVWVVDDNFQAVSNTDSFEVWVVNQPGFRISSSNLGTYPNDLDINQPLQFPLMVENVHPERYKDQLFFNLEINGMLYTIASDGDINIPGETEVEFNHEAIRMGSPPFYDGANHLRMWVNGVGNARAVDTLEYEMNVFGGLVDAPAPTEPSADAYQVIHRPGQGTLSILTGADMQVEDISFYDMTGRKVRELQGSGPHDLRQDANFDSGVYWLNIRFRNGSHGLEKLLFVR